MRSCAVLASAAILLAAVVASGCSRKEEAKPAAPQAPAAPAPSPVAEGKALFEQKCGVCHDLDRAAARSETPVKWAEIIKRMQEKKADWISDGEAAKILAYLSAEHGKK